jgi:mRNA interferase YafQ
MTRRIIESSAFRRDIKRTQKRGKDLKKLFTLVETLANGEQLSAIHKAHPLQGEWKPMWECHIEFDWLLIYVVTKDEVRLARTGTHDDLFKR